MEIAFVSKIRLLRLAQIVHAADRLDHEETPVNG
jgi:hypothetical protein